MSAWHIMCIGGSALQNHYFCGRHTYSYEQNFDSYTHSGNVGRIVRA